MNQGGKPASPRKLAWTGASWSVLLAFPIAGLLAVVFRFPVPFTEYQSGFAAIIPAMFIVFYGVFLGGFILLGVLGAIGGMVASRIADPKLQRPERTVRLVSCSITAICLFILAILDKIIGPW